MPSRFGTAVIILFWLGTSGLVVYRDLVPRLFASGPPPITIDLADEAGQFVPVRWKLLRGDKKIGSLTTEMKYLDADDTFRFTHTYHEVTLEVGGVRVRVPDLIEKTRVTRTGELRSQSLDGRIVASIGAVGFTAFEFSATAKLRSEVANGMLTGQVTVSAPGLASFDRPLQPVPVPSGRVLNPLQPVNRLAQVRPGLRWVVPEVNPLRDAVAAMVKEAGVALPEARANELIAEVASEPQTLTYRNEPAACWVIEYRATAPVARTWVQISDGKVLRQEAFNGDERISLERDD